MKIGVFQPLDHAKLTLWENLDPWVLKLMAQYDPGNRYSVPYMWGTTGFAYNVEMVRERMPDAPLGSASMLFDPEVVAHFADCGVTMLDQGTTVIPMVMLYLGYDPHSVVPAQLAEAEAVLKSVRPYIRYFSSAQFINDLPNSETCVAMAWSRGLRPGAGPGRRSGCRSTPGLYGAGAKARCCGSTACRSPATHRIPKTPTSFSIT